MGTTSIFICSLHPEKFETGRPQKKYIAFNPPVPFDPTPTQVRKVLKMEQVKNGGGNGRAPGKGIGKMCDRKMVNQRY